MVDGVTSSVILSYLSFLNQFAHLYNEDKIGLSNTVGINHFKC